MPPFALIALLGLAPATTCGVPANETKSGVLTYEPNCAYVAPLRTAAERRNDAIYREVRRVAGAIRDAYNRHDVHAAAAYDAPDFFGYFSGMDPAFGPKRDEYAMKAMLARGIEWQGAPGLVTLVGNGDVAVFETNYYFVFHDAGGKVTRRQYGHWLAIFARQRDGSMKRWRSTMIDTPDPVYPSPLPLPPRPRRP